MNVDVIWYWFYFSSSRAATSPGRNDDSKQLYLEWRKSAGIEQHFSESTFAARAKNTDDLMIL